jgi:hypothetical protein
VPIYFKLLIDKGRQCLGVMGYCAPQLVVGQIYQTHSHSPNTVTERGLWGYRAKNSLMHTTAAKAGIAR